MEISWQSKLHVEPESKVPSLHDGIKNPLLEGDHASPAEESQLKLSPKTDGQGQSATLKEPVYFMNLHTLPYMSIGVHVAPHLSIESE